MSDGYIDEKGLMFSAAIDCGQLHDHDEADDDPRENVIISMCVDEIPADDDAYADVEGDLLERFVGRVFETVHRVTKHTGSNVMSCYHFYVHSEGKRRFLASALNRHADRDGCRVMRNVFDLRGGHMFFN